MDSGQEVFSIRVTFIISMKRVVVVVVAVVVVVVVGGPDVITCTDAGSFVMFNLLGCAVFQGISRSVRLCWVTARTAGGELLYTCTCACKRQHPFKSLD